MPISINGTGLISGLQNDSLTGSVITAVSCPTVSTVRMNTSYGAQMQGGYIAIGY